MSTQKPQYRRLLVDLAGEIDAAARLAGWAPAHRHRIDDQIEALIEKAAELSVDWPSWARSRLDTSSDRTQGAQVGSRQVGAISDPTLAAVVAAGDEHAVKVLAHIEEALNHAAAAARLMAGIRRTADAARLVQILKEARCTGGKGMPGADVWGNPTCTANHVRQGLCWTEYRAMLAWKREQAEEAAAATKIVRCEVCEGTGRVTA